MDKKNSTSNESVIIGHGNNFHDPSVSIVVGDYIYGMAVSPTGATFVATLGGAIYRNDAP